MMVNGIKQEEEKQPNTWFRGKRMLGDYIPNKH